MLHKVSDIRNIRVKYMCHIIANGINDLLVSELRGKKARHRRKGEIKLFIQHVEIFVKLLDMFMSS